MSGDLNSVQRSPINSHAVRERAIAQSDRRSQNRLTDAALQWLCVSMTLIAAAVFLVTEADGNRSAIAMTVEMLGWSAVVIAAAWWVRRKVAALPETSFMMPLLILVVLLSLAWEPIQRLVLDSGRPFEMLIMFSQKNLMLALAVFGCRISCQRLAVVIAVFMTIFCAVISSDRLVQALVGCFAVLAILWLTAGYWESIRVRLLSHDQSASPRLWVGIIALVPLILLLAFTPQGNTMMQSLRGFMPGSGGDQDSDPFSRGGVNDGEALVAGKDQIRSFAPIEDAPFADSDQPSLFDVVNDQFDEPVRKMKDFDKSIALPPSLMAEVNQRLAKSKQAAREFSTLRRNSEGKQQKIKDLPSKALFYVSGRVPLHFRMEVYDVYDGLDWYPEAEDQELHGMAVLTLGGRPWLRIPCGNRSLGLFCHAETHAIKVVNLRTNLIPSPLDLRGIHIDRVDRDDMYEWHKQGMIRMNRKSLPELTAIQLMSERLDRSQLLLNRQLMMSSPMQSHYLQTPQTLHMNAITELAREWTKDVPQGWSQVEAISRKLRENYTIDRKCVPEESCEFPVGEFLFRTRRGPEYLFASSAAMLLRSLGYPTRLVSGFYARPENYDVRKRHTSVQSADVHFWCEVFIGAGTWVTVEPSPGYQILEAPPTFWMQVWTQVRSAFQIMVAHWIISLSITAAILLSVWYRRELIDLICTWIWRLSPAATPRERILQTVRLVDRRLRYAGIPRHKGMTFERWLKSQQTPVSFSPVLSQFADAASWAAFAPDTSRSVPNDITNCCHQVQTELSLRNCRKAAVTA